ncbi:MAG TPA: hypothetical protein VF703_04095 [Pyrinomonadaceae bacterium]|jgi:hypothetical protein
MSRHQFRLLIVLYQVCIFGSLIVYEMTIGSVAPESGGYLDGGSVVEEAGGGGLSGGYTDWLYYVHLFASLVASLGLFLFQSWGRTLFLLCAIFYLLTTPVYESYVNTGWASTLGYLASLFEGMILALIFFSHLRRLFNGAAGDVEGAAS